MRSWSPYAARKLWSFKRKVDEFLAKNVVDRGAIRELAGLCSWIGSNRSSSQAVHTDALGSGECSTCRGRTICVYGTRVGVVAFAVVARFR